MKKLILILFTLSACCDNKVDVEYKVVEKFHLQDREGYFVRYKLLLENGEEISIESKDYAKAKVGDIWIVKECKE